MSGLAFLVVGGFTVVALWGVYMGWVGCTADHPPFMQGEGGSSRFDTRLSRSA